MSRFSVEKLGIALVLVVVCLALAPMHGMAEEPPKSRSNVWASPIDMAASVAAPRPMAYPCVCVDSRQNVHVFWGDRGGEDSAGALFYCTDAGGGWSTPRDVVVSPTGVVIRISAAINPKTDTIHVAWVNSFLNGTLFYSSAPLARAGSWDAWSAPMSVAGNCSKGSMLVDRDGVVHLVYGVTDASSTNLVVYDLRCLSDGADWEDPVLVADFSVAIPATIDALPAADEAGRVHMGITINSLEYGVASEVGYTRSLDNGETWEAYRMVSDESTSFQGLSTMAPWAFGRDEVHLTWHDPGRMHMMSTDGGESWGAVSKIIDIGAAFGGANELAKDSAGRLYALTAVGNGVYVSLFDGHKWGSSQLIDGRFIDPHFQRLAVSQGNRLHVFYSDRFGVQTVWYSTRTVDAPHIAQADVPTLVPSATPIRTPTKAPTVPSSIVGSRQLETQQNTNSHIEMALVPAVAPVLVLLLLLVVFRKK